REALYGRGGDHCTTLQLLCAPECRFRHETTSGREAPLVEPGLHRKVAQQLGGGNSSETHVNWSAPRDGATAATSLPSGRMTSRPTAASCLVKNAIPASFGSHTGFHALPCSDVSAWISVPSAFITSILDRSPFGDIAVKAILLPSCDQAGSALRACASSCRSSVPFPPASITQSCHRLGLKVSRT